MEIKIFCDCGAKYKFDTEPVNGFLPGPVQCPVCGVDGTAKGNAIIQASLAAAPAVESTLSAATPSPVIAIPKTSPAPAIAIPPSGAAAPKGFVAPVIPRSSKAAAAQVESTAPPPPPQTPPIPIPVPIPVGGAVSPKAAANKLSVASVHAPTAATPPPPPPAGQPFDAGTPPIPPTSSVTTNSPIPANGPSVSRGLIGVALASFVSLLVWFAITTVFFSRLKWLAVGIGLFIGWTGRKMGRTSSPKLAFAASIATVMIMLFGSLWAGHREADLLTDKTLKEMYDSEVAYAKEAVKAKTDEEIAAVINNGPGNSSDDEDGIRQISAKSTEVDSEVVSDWKRKELPELRKLASGQISRYAYEREHRPLVETVFGVATLFSHTFRISMIIWMAIGATTSYKMVMR